MLKRVVLAEGTYSLEFNMDLLAAFLFPKQQHVDPLRLRDPETPPILTLRSANMQNYDKQLFTSQAYFEKMLEFLLSSVLMQINTAKYAEVTHTDTEVKELRKQAKLTVKFIVDRLHKRVVDQENISSDLINLSNSLNSDSISKLKKIFIFLRES